MSESIFQSKYLKKAVNLADVYGNDDEEDSSSSGSDSDSESETETTFIIDSKPESNVEVKVEKKRGHILGATLNDGFKVEPYLSSKRTPEESVKILDNMSVKAMNEQLSEKLVIKPGFEQNYLIKSFTQSKRRRKHIRKLENAKTLGNKWFGMTADEMTDEKKNDLLALSMRSGWDPKRFYKKNERKNMPKFFQIGTIIESKADYYHSRVPKKDRKRTLVEELLADANVKRYNKKKYTEALAKDPYYLKMKRRKQRQQMKAKGFDFKKKKNEKKSKRKTKTKDK